MATFASTLERVKQDLAGYLSDTVIRQAFLDAGHRWRKRKFDPVTTVQLFVLQVLSFNTAITHLRHLAGMPVNAAAYCKARMRLPLAAMASLLERLASSIAGIQGQKLWCGLRTCLVDGSCSIAPDTKDNQKQFPQPKGQQKGCGFSIPKLLGLFDVYSGLVTKVVFGPLYRHDLRGAIALHPALGQGDLVVGDRAFCSYVHFAVLNQRQVMAVFRLHASRRASFEPAPCRRRQGGKKQRHQRQRNKRQVRRKLIARAGTLEIVRQLGKNDQIVRWKKPVERPSWIKAGAFKKLPDEMLIRELRFVTGSRRGRTRVVIIATSLLDPELYPLEKLAELYGLRWRVETHFAELKTTLKMRRIKCQTALGVQKEMVIFCLVYNLVHALMQEAAVRQKTTPDRISFIDALRWMLSAAPGEALPKLLVNPLRKGRQQPRVVKDRHDGYQRMTRPRSEMNKNPGDWPGRK